MLLAHHITAPQYKIWWGVKIQYIPVCTILEGRFASSIAPASGLRKNSSSSGQGEGSPSSWPFSYSTEGPGSSSIAASRCFPRKPVTWSVHTSIYQYIPVLVCTSKYIYVHTSMYVYILYSIIWYHATVRDSGYLDVCCPPSLVPINPRSYRHIQT